MRKFHAILLASVFVLNTAPTIHAEESLAVASEELPAKNDWQSKVIKPMQAAQAHLQKSEATRNASSAQAEAITGLDAIITELSQRKSQCKGGPCSTSKCNKPGTPKAGSGKAGKSPANAAASPTAINSVDQSAQLAVAGDLVKNLWGKLPERQRKQILQPLSEEFLPKYATEIEAYFRALADPSRSSSISQ